VSDTFLFLEERRRLTIKNLACSRSASSRTSPTQTWWLDYFLYLSRRDYLFLTILGHRTSQRSAFAYSQGKVEILTWPYKAAPPEVELVELEVLELEVTVEDLVEEVVLLDRVEEVDETARVEDVLEDPGLMYKEASGDAT
jgi:hypothetical protein